MKLLATTLLIFLAIFYGNAQDINIEKLRQLELNDTIIKFTADTVIVHGAFNKTDTLYVNDLKKEFSTTDTTRIRVGKRNVIIIENGDKTSIEIPNSKDKHTFDSNKNKNYKYVYKPRFKGNWAGLEFGLNGVMDPEHSLNMQGDLRYFEINQARSLNLNINPMQYSIGFGTDKVGLVTGLGLELNIYRFRNNNTIRVDDNGITVADYSYVGNPDMNVTKSSLRTLHLVAPLLLEFNLPSRHPYYNFFVSVGVLGGARIGSNTKIVYKGTTKGKDKIRDDFNMNPFRYGFTARIGFNSISLFVNYYMTPMFEQNKGDELYPFTIGLRLLDF